MLLNNLLIRQHCMLQWYFIWS